MDSITQLLLGSAVGEATMGRQVGRKATLWGAVCGTIPDLDVFVSLGGPVHDFTYHRSFSHSLLVLALVTPLMVWLIRKIHPQYASYHARWYWMVYLCFATHVLLDCFTVYGTQIFWPIVTTPVSWGSIFIIDPLYTLPLLLAILVALWSKEHTSRVWRFNLACLLASSMYLSWSVIAKLHVAILVEQTLQAQNIQHHKFDVISTPFNTLLWRVIVMDQNGYYEGLYSLLDSNKEIQLRYRTSQTELLNRIPDHWPVNRLKWFTHGFYRVGLEANEVIMTDLRMGFNDRYVFRFKIAERLSDDIIATPAEARSSPPNFSSWPMLLDRIRGQYPIH